MGYYPVVRRLHPPRHMHLAELRLAELHSSALGELRRMLDSLCNLDRLSINWPAWPPVQPDRLPPQDLRSTHETRLRLRYLRISAEAHWINDARTTYFFDWLSTSGALSEVKDVELDEVMLINNAIVEAVERVLRAVRSSPRLDSVWLSLGPNVNWTVCKSFSTLRSVSDPRELVSSSLANLPKLSWLRLVCPYDPVALLQLAEHLQAVLSRPEHDMHSNLDLYFDQYPSHDVPEPSADCWTKIDRAVVQHRALNMYVDRTIRLVLPGEPLVWGNSYIWERKGWWIAETRRMFPRTYMEGRLWAIDVDGEYRHVKVGINYFFRITWTDLTCWLRRIREFCVYSAVL